MAAEVAAKGFLAGPLALFTHHGNRDVGDNVRMQGDRHMMLTDRFQRTLRHPTRDPQPCLKAELEIPRAQHSLH